MNAGILPLLMLCAALGFALYATPIRQAWIALAMLGGTALLLSVLIKPSSVWDKPLFLGLWATTAILAGLVHLRSGLRGPATLIAALIAGVWVGSIAGLAGEPRSALLSLPAALLFLPSAWVRSLGYGIAIKVVSSWLVAISLLAAMVSLTPTPGYQQDHME